MRNTPMTRLDFVIQKQIQTIFTSPGKWHVMHHNICLLGHCQKAEKYPISVNYPAKFDAKNQHKIYNSQVATPRVLQPFETCRC